MADENVTQAGLGDSDDDLDAIYERVLTCESAIPLSELEPLADLIKSQERFGRQWRLTALLASKDGAFYRELSVDEDKAKALAPTVDLLSDFAKLLRTMADFADCASSRVMVVGCNHEHFNEWMEEAHA